ncbi:MAG: hypothetical protein JXR58_07735, partial [Bacteroidales bacterium]|nr:hypothetical protein [Bacteroidales bacterium]
MKRFLFFLLAITFFFNGLNTLNAQRIDIESESGFDIGFGLGGSYQTSDIRNFYGGGWTFTFGHSIFQKKDAFFGLDWRFRFLGGLSTAFDDRINIDSTYNNLQYTHFNYDFEFVLTFNRLMENTGVKISLFGGGGLAHNITKHDLYIDDMWGFGVIQHDYSIINPYGTDSRRKIYNDLKDLSDGSFETPGSNQLCFTPTIGIYLGYKFTKHFSLGLEHKINFFLKEDNQLTGANIDGVINNSSKIDRNNYTALVFVWDIGKKQNNSHTNNNHTVDPTNPCYPPLINVSVVELSNSAYTHQLTGSITNMKSSAGVLGTIDDTPDNNFRFVPATNEVSSFYNLDKGTHKVYISAKNECGMDTETKQIIVGSSCPTPVVNMSFAKTNNSTYSLSGSASNIKYKSSLTITLDGKPDYSFSFNSGSNSFNSSYNLSPGSHTVTVTAKNDCGQDSESATVVEGTPCDSPSVLSLSFNETNQGNFTHSLTAIVSNINNKTGVNVTLDGKPDNSFTFNAATGKIGSSYKLLPGTHNVMVSVRNDCGQDSKSKHVTVTEPCKSPVVNIALQEKVFQGFTHELS